MTKTSLKFESLCHDDLDHFKHLWKITTFSAKLCSMAITCSKCVAHNVSNKVSKWQLPVQLPTEMSRFGNLCHDYQDRIWCTNGTDVWKIHVHITTYVHHRPSIPVASWWQYTTTLRDHGDWLHTHHVMNTSKPDNISHPLSVHAGNGLPQ